MRAQRPPLIGASVLFVGALGACGDAPPTAPDTLAGTACPASEEGRESCQSDYNIYRCTDGTRVFVRSATVTTGCPVIGYVGVTRAGRARDTGRRLRAEGAAAWV